MSLSAEQRLHIRRSRDAAVRAGWDAHSRNAAKLDPEEILDAFDGDTWLTAGQVAERIGLRPQQTRWGRPSPQRPLGRRGSRWPGYDAASVSANDPASGMSSRKSLLSGWFLPRP